MGDFICPYACSYRTNSGYCGYTGGYDACQYRLIAQKPTIKRRAVYRGDVYNAIAIVAINDDRGVTGTQYYGCGVEDKGRMIHHINEDIIMDVILNNAKTIHDILIESEDDEDEMEERDCCE